jgi:hypothetical protein
MIAASTVGLSNVWSASLATATTQPSGLVAVLVSATLLLGNDWAVTAFLM